MVTTWILDNGHGGMLGARYYQTAGKRSPVVEPGLGVFEGEFNRDVVKRVLGLCQRRGVHAIDLVPGAENASLKERKRRVRELMATFGKSKLISVHANAFGSGGWNNTKGSRIFTRKPDGSKWYDESLLLARNLKSEMIFRGLSDPKIKAANFAILSCALPSILFEAAFMTNKHDAALLADDSFRQSNADMLFNLMVEDC